jgi:gliding motility-associated-like protein
MPYQKQKILILCLLILKLNCFGQDRHDNQHNDIKFLENKGQWKENVLFRAVIPDGFLFLENKGLTYLFYDGETYDHLKHNFGSSGVLDFHSVKVEFLDAGIPSSVIPSDKTDEYYNFFLGKDKSKWASGVNGFYNIKYEGIYSGIDAVLSGIECQLEYSFFLKPNADPSQIKMRYRGANNLYVEQGDLHVVTSINSFVEFTPHAYSIVDGVQLDVECNFKVDGDVLSYDFPQGYNSKYPLVIDPIVIFSTFSGSLADNFGYTATYDDSGYAYSGGTVFDVDFPTTSGAYQDTFMGGGPGQPGSGDGRDIGILKYSPDGSKLIYCTYLGGTGNEDPHSMVVNSKYELVIFGNVNSTDFPIGQHFWDVTYNGNYDMYLAKLSVDGRQLLGSTYVGGSDEDAVNVGSTLSWNYGDIFRGEVVVDDNDNVYVITTTKSTDFPVTSGVFQSTFGGGLQDACIVKLSQNLDSLLNSSFIGGSNEDAGFGIVIDAGKDIYVCGGTKSANLQVKPGKYQTTFQGGEADGFIYKIASNFNFILASTYLGTTKYDQTYFIQTDRYNNVYVTGQTKADSFPVIRAKYYNPQGKQFIVKMSTLLDSVIYSSVFGSGRISPDLSPSAFLVDNCERVYFSGWGGSANQSGYNKGYTNNLPCTPDAYQKTTDGSDFFLAVFARNMDDILYGSYFGGPQSSEHVDGGTSRFDKKGVVYQSVCGGCGGYSDFPTTPNAWSRINKGHRPGIPHTATPNGCNNALFKLDLEVPDVFADFNIKNLRCLADSTNIKNTSKGGLTYEWDFGDGDTSWSFEPKHVYSDTGTYYIRLIVHNIFSCTSSDTVIKPVVVHNHINLDFVFDSNECVNNIAFRVTTEPRSSYIWYFGDSTRSLLENPVHAYKRDTGTYLVRLYADSGSVCESVQTKIVKVGDYPFADFSYVIDTCFGRLTFTNLSLRSKKWLWDFGDAKFSNLKNPVHEYLSSGTFGITLYAEPGSVCADSAYNTVQIKVPKANAIVDLDTCNFKAILINPSRHLFNKSIWYFGDGDSLYYIDSVFHQYQGPGTYNIKLIANSGTICEDTVVQTIVIPDLPQAEFTFNLQPCSPFVLFKNLSDHSARSDWDFGSGFITNNSDSFVYRFDTSGQYIITLKSYSLAACIDKTTDTLNIDKLAYADFNFLKDTCSTEVRFKNLSTKTGSSFWDFGDQKQSNITSPVHFYDSSGSYNVTLIITDNPCVDTIVKKINIYDKAPFSFECIFDTCSMRIRLKPLKNDAFSYFWQLGDGKSSTDKTLDYIYASSGVYNITLTINRDTICADSVSKEITIFKYRKDEIEVPNIFTPNNDGVNELFTVKGLNIHCDIYKLWVYNRWGQLIFESLPNRIEWDGRTEGELVSPGTYYFILQGIGFEIVGTVTVVY